MFVGNKIIRVIFDYFKFTNVIMLTRFYVQIDPNSYLCVQLYMHVQTL